MGIFDAIKQTVKVGLDVATLPVDIVKDVATMGGILTDEESSTLKKLNKTVDDVNDLPNKIDE